MKQLFLAILFLCCIGSGITSARPDGLPETTDGLLKLLDEELDRRDKYMTRPLRHIDSLRQKLDTATDSRTKLLCFEKLGSEFEGINADSSIHYYTNGIETAWVEGDSSCAQRCVLKRCFQLTLIGAIKECLDQLNVVESMGVLPENQELLYTTGRYVYYTLAAFYPYHKSADDYRTVGIPYARGSMNMLPPNTPEHELDRALIHYSHHRDIHHIAALNEVIELSSTTDRNFVQASTMLGEYYLTHGKTDDAINAFASAAIASIRNADRHGTALMRLGMALYNQGDISAAHRYLTTALDNAVTGGARMNVAPISQALLPVQDDFNSIDHRRYTTLTIFLIILLLLLSAIVVLILRQRHEMKKLKTMKKRLSDANMVKETYITEFLNLCSANMEKIEEFSRLCRRKITANQTEELLAYIKSGKAIEEQRQIFYSIFDDAFIHIFPTFIADVNRLLLPDRQLATQSASTMNTELRILAFTRLGMDDTARIARFLGLSLNTIYTYRNKMRNRAINRETFETDVMKIGQIA